MLGKFDYFHKAEGDGVVVAGRCCEERGGACECVADVADEGVPIALVGVRVRGYGGNVIPG